MKPRATLSTLLILAFAGLIAGLAWTQDEVSESSDRRALLDIEIGAVPRVEAVRRIGLNLGHWTYWGAEQLARNILKNPGFEGLVDRALVRVASADRFRFTDDQAWLAREDGFWAGATLEVLSGDSTDRTGAILDSLATGEAGLPEFIARDPLPPLAVGDIVSLTRIRDDLPPTHWWLPEASSGVVRVEQALTAPGSPGRRGLVLKPHSGQTMRLSSHLDSIGARAGNLLPVNGPWRLGLWVHGSSDARPSVRVLFRRHGSSPFVDHVFSPEPGWHRLEQRFEARDDGPIGALELLIEVTGPGEIALDDLWLGPEAPTTATDAETRALAAFRSEVIETLRRLAPGYLRDWQGQLGDTLENRLADPWARRANRYRPGTSSEYGYGLPEFLDLSRAVGANPWLILPTTFSTDEARRLGAWLAERIASDGFEEVLVEFGNENWNPLFRPAGIQDPVQHGMAADRAFAALMDGAGSHPAIRRVANAQHANPEAALKVAASTQEADVLALAPYFFTSLDAADQGQALDLLFADDDGRLREIVASLPERQSPAVYEVNLHTTRGDASSLDRNALVAGAAAGPALAKRLLEALASGARRQCVYTLAGFDTKHEDGQTLLPLFGVTRDLTRAERFRPTGWALAMLNQVIAGDLHPAARTDGGELSGLLVAPFRGPQGWSVAVVAFTGQPQRLMLRFPEVDAPLPTRGLVLDASDPFANNENAETVAPRGIAIRHPGHDRIMLAVPAYGLIVAGPETLRP